MKIYESTEYIENHTVGELKLEVINQWGFSARPVCFDSVKTIGGETQVISYLLKRTTQVYESGGWKYEIVAELTDEMKDELVDMGYTVPAPKPQQGEK